MSIVVGRTTYILQDRNNRHTANPICNKQILSKILLKRKCKENAKTSKVQQCDSTIGLHLLQIKIAQTKRPAIFYSLLGKNYISFFSTRIYLHQNAQSYFMSQERNCLFIANFTLVSVYPMLTICYL